MVIVHNCINQYLFSGLPGVNLAHISRQMESKLVKEKYERLCLKTKILDSVPRDQRYRLPGLVVVVRDGFMRTD